MTNSIPMTEILTAAESLSRQNDRVAFFVATISLVCFGLLAVRYLVQQAERNAIQMHEITRDLREVVVNNTASLNRAHDAIERNTNALDQFDRNTLRKFNA